MNQHSTPNQTGTSTLSGSDRDPEIPDPSQWHKTSSLSDGTPVGRLGASWYILDENGSAVSNGYHGIYRDEHGDYIGERSGHTEPIVIYTKPD